MVSNKLTAGAQSLGKAPRFNLQSGLRLRLRESHGLKWVFNGHNKITLLQHKQDIALTDVEFVKCFTPAVIFAMLHKCRL